MKMFKRYAIRYENNMYHCWDCVGHFDFAESVDQAHLVNSRDAAMEIANLIRNEFRRKCEVVEVQCVYMLIENVEKRGSDL